MKRDDWMQRLQALLRERERMPFTWGSVDCCLWAADAVLAMTGRDPAKEFRGRYRTERGAARALLRCGGIEAAGARVGEEIPPLCAGIGDVGLVDGGAGLALGVCIGELWMLACEQGLGPVPFNAARKAWRVA